MIRFKTTSSLTLASVLLAGIWTACSPASQEKPDEGSTGDGDVDLGNGGIDIDGGGTSGLGSGEPWPATPVMSADAPAGVEALFSGASTGAGCVTEPSDGSMIPRNWLRPRFRVSGGATAYQVILSAEGMENDLVGYAGPGGWSIPYENWVFVARLATSAPVPVTATVRAHNGTGFTESVVTFQIAPANAGGAMVYWASRVSKDHVDSSELKGFTVGDEAVVTTLKPIEVQEGDIRSYDSYALKSNAGGEWNDATGAAPGKPSCIGCHTSTPDGAAVAFNDGFPWAGLTASIETETKGQRAAGVSDLGSRLLKTPFIGTIAFSQGHWAPGDRYALASFTSLTPYNNVIANLSNSADLVWINLEAEGSADFSANPDDLFNSFKGSGWDVVARTGDTRAAANPAWNAAGDLIAYASVDRVAGSHVGGIEASTVAKQPDKVLPGPTEADLYTVPFNDGAGGPATPLAGAAEPGIAEYYPDFSPDGKFIAFNRAPSTNGYIYYRPDGEVNVIPTTGGQPHRLVANDPPACTGEASPGVINSWPKWGPSTESANGGTYYWVIFSSARAYEGQTNIEPDYYTPEVSPGVRIDTRSSQLYLAGVFVKADGTIESYPGVYIWNQSNDTSNLTPAWDEFKIDPITVR